MANDIVLSTSPTSFAFEALTKRPFFPTSHKGQISLYKEPFLEFPQVLSKDTVEIKSRLQQLRSPTAPSLLGSHAESLTEKLFDATVGVKVLTSQVAMYLDSQWRSKLFNQIDSLHHVDDWEHGDEPLQRESFATFLKAICELKPKKRPGLGLTHSGQLIAAWTAGTSRLTIEFSVSGRVKWIISRTVEDEVEHYVGDTTVSRLAAGLQPHHVEEWFG